MNWNVQDKYSVTQSKLKPMQVKQGAREFIVILKIIVRDS